MIMECFIYSSADMCSICISYNQYIDGFLRIGYNGLDVHASCYEDEKMLKIVGIDNYDN